MFKLFEGDLLHPSHNVTKNGPFTLRYSGRAQCGGDGSITAFIAGYEASATNSFIMRKPVTNGCLYAFKAEDACATGLSRAGGFSVSRNGVSMSALGCELQNPDNLPVFELPSSSL